jgi:radical SAM-linked protein
VFALNKYRLKFEKKDKMIYIGHLDLMTFFQRAIKRAKLPIAYSNGFNPHQQMSFAVPLSLGSYGYGEYVDIELKEDVPESEILQRLNSAMNKGMQIVAVRKLAEGEKTGAAIVTAADYRVTLGTKIENINDVISELIASDTMEIERVSKRKTKVVNIRPNIYNLTANNDAAKTVLNMRIATGSANNLKAELVSEYICKFCGIEFDAYALVIERLGLLKGDIDSGFSAL